MRSKMDILPSSLGRVSLLVFMAFAMFGTMGCSLTAGEGANEAKKDVRSIWGETDRRDSGGDLADLYIMVLDKTYQTDPALNEGVTYIAIDPDSLPGMEEREKTRVKAHFKKYHQQVVFANLQELGIKEKQGNSIALQGVLLSLEKVEQKSDGKWLISAMKFRSSLGAAGATYIASYEDGKWKLQATGEAWMA